MGILRQTFFLLIYVTTLNAEQSDTVIRHVIVEPADQRETVLSILPFQEGDYLEQKLIPIADKLLRSTEKFESQSVDWVPATNTVKVIVRPRLFFDQII